MKISLIIIAVILLLLIAVFFLPISVFIKFKDDFFLKIKFSGFKIFEIKPEKDIKKIALPDKVSDKKAENEVLDTSKQIFLKLKEKLGFTGAVKEILRFANDVLSHIKRLLRNIKIKRVCLDITVAADDAATTAIEYGAVCAAVYPVTALLSTCADIGFKQINVKSDFDSKKPDFQFEATASMNVFNLLIAAFKTYSEYKKFTVRNELQ